MEHLDIRKCLLTDAALIRIGNNHSHLQELLLLNLWRHERFVSNLIGTPMRRHQAATHQQENFFEPSSLKSSRSRSSEVLLCIFLHPSEDGFSFSEREPAAEANDPISNGKAVAQCWVFSI